MTGPEAGPVSPMARGRDGTAARIATASSSHAASMQLRRPRRKCPHLREPASATFSFEGTQRHEIWTLDATHSAATRWHNRSNGLDTQRPSDMLSTTRILSDNKRCRQQCLFLFLERCLTADNPACASLRCIASSGKKEGRPTLLPSGWIHHGRVNLRKLGIELDGSN